MKCSFGNWRKLMFPQHWKTGSPMTHQGKNHLNKHTNWSQFSPLAFGSFCSICARILAPFSVFMTIIPLNTLQLWEASLMNDIKAACLGVGHMPPRPATPLVTKSQSEMGSAANRQPAKSGWTWSDHIQESSGSHAPTCATRAKHSCAMLSSTCSNPTSSSRGRLSLISFNSETESAKSCLRGNGVCCFVISPSKHCITPSKFPASSSLCKYCLLRSLLCPTCRLTISSAEHSTILESLFVRAIPPSAKSQWGQICLCCQTSRGSKYNMLPVGRS